MTLLQSFRGRGDGERIIDSVYAKMAKKQKRRSATVVTVRWLQPRVLDERLTCFFASLLILSHLQSLRNALAKLRLAGHKLFCKLF